MRSDYCAKYYVQRRWSLVSSFVVRAYSDIAVPLLQGLETTGSWPCHQKKQTSERSTQGFANHQEAGWAGFHVSPNPIEFYPRLWQSTGRELCWFSPVPNTQCEFYPRLCQSSGRGLSWFSPVPKTQREFYPSSPQRGGWAGFHPSEDAEPEPDQGGGGAGGPVPAFRAGGVARHRVVDWHLLAAGGRHPALPGGGPLHRHQAERHRVETVSTCIAYLLTWLKQFF